MPPLLFIKDTEKKERNNGNRGSKNQKYKSRFIITQPIHVRGLRTQQLKPLPLFQSCWHVKFKKREEEKTTKRQ
jgi:hypothetical protein